MSKTPPRVFISYSHDDAQHKAWVAGLGLRLRQNGVDAALDQWDLYAGDDIPCFMERNLTECDFAVLVCTKRYVEKANAGDGGVGYEKMIVTSELIKNIEVSKFIPVIRQAGTQQVPKFIATKLYIDFSNDDEFEVVFDELLRTIFRSAITDKPPLGTAPSFEDGKTRQSIDNVDLPDDAAHVFNAIGREYDRGGQTWWNGGLLVKAGITGRLAGENALLVLEARGLLEEDNDGDYVLSAAGKALLLDLTRGA